MTVCWYSVRLEKDDMGSKWTIKWMETDKWVETKEVVWEDFTHVISQIKNILWCGNNFQCKCNDCSIVRVYEDWRKTILALI